jgi:hypothetical protein
MTDFSIWQPIGEERGGLAVIRRREGRRDHSFHPEVEAGRSSETFVSYRKTTRRRNPKELGLNPQSCENSHLGSGPIYCPLCFFKQLSVCTSSVVLGIETFA